MRRRQREVEPSAPRGRGGTWERDSSTRSRTVRAAEMVQDSGRLMKILGRGRRDRNAEAYAERGIPTYDIRAGQAEATGYLARGVDPNG